MRPFLCSLLLVVQGCVRPSNEEGERPRLPHVVLVSIDTLHVDRVSPYNPAVDTTPFLAGFATEGTRFARAYTQVPITLPSHASLMTGVSPQTLGVLANGDSVPEQAATLAELLAEAGYRTAAFPSLGVLRPEFGLAQGFDHYDDPFAEGPRRWYRRADEVLERVTKWVGESAGDGRPTFLWVHLSDPHEPYLPVGAPPDTDLFLDEERVGSFSLVSGERQDVTIELPAGRHRLRFHSLREPRADDRPETAIVLRLASSVSLERHTADSAPAAGSHPLDPDLALELDNPGARPVEVELRFTGVLERPTPGDVLPSYDAEVAYTDAHLRELDAVLTARDIADETLFIIVSDHGEGLFRHDFLGHTTHVYEDQLRVVWLMRGPGVPRGLVIDEAAARLTDVVPTLLDVLRLPASPSVEGRSWASCLAAGACPPDTPFWAYGLEHDPRQLTMMAAYDGPWKWVWQRGLGRSAFDLASDPWETNDLLLDAGPDNPEPLKHLAESFPDARRALDRSIRAEHENRERSSTETEDMLESLGYITRPEPPPR